MRIGGDLLVRTGALLAAFTLASAVLARESARPRSPPTRSRFQLFIFLALVLDAIAIAGQVLVGRMLGAGDADGRAGGRAADDRLVAASSASSSRWRCSPSATCCPQAFTSDDAVLDEARELWPLFALLQPVGAVVFALDGILIGAGDTRFIARAMVARASPSSRRSCSRRSRWTGASSASGRRSTC